MIMNKTNESCKLQFGATSSPGTNKHPYMKNNWKGSKEIQEIRKLKGIKIEID